MAIPIRTPNGDHFAEIRQIGIIMNGVTGRMGTNQHLIRSIMAIIKQGGIKISDDLTLMPDPILTGRNINKLADLAKALALKSTPIISMKYWPIPITKSSSTLPAPFTARSSSKWLLLQVSQSTAKSQLPSKPKALALAELCEKAGLKNGVVQDKLWLPGLRKFQMIKDQGFFGDILSVRGEFGYWVFTGEHYDQPAQRPSWNYRKADGGGIIVDMLCHWRYVIDNCFGNVKAVSCMGATHIPTRIDEQGKPYDCDTDDSAYATFELDNGVIAHFNSSWNGHAPR